MPLNNQPYLPLYVKDWLANNKLQMCSAAAHGIMINLMCILHKEEDYGRILLRQRFKQSYNQTKNFACMLDRMLGFSIAEIEPALEELIDEKVIKIDGEYLACSRMIRDGELSAKRSKSGKKGGDVTGSKFAEAKTQANPESVNEDEDGSETPDRTGDILDPRFKIWFEAYGKQVGTHACANIWRGMRPQEKEMCENVTPLYVEATPSVQYRQNPKNFLLDKSYMDEHIVRNFNEENNGDWIKKRMLELAKVGS